MLVAQLFRIGAHCLSVVPHNDLLDPWRPSSLLPTLATAEKRAMRAGRRPIKVTGLTMTDAGRQALG
jgi:hypothetical protein